jgi:hypothetical protein
MSEAEIGRVWRQGVVPVLWRTGKKGGPLYVKLPYDVFNRSWLKKPRGRDPVWNQVEKRWEVPVAWFNDLVEKCLTRFGRVYIVQPFREQEKCSPACQNAQGHICECSCMGEHHGAGNDGSWFEVSDTFSTRWGANEVACRLLTRN